MAWKPPKTDEEVFVPPSTDELISDENAVSPNALQQVAEQINVPSRIGRSAAVGMGGLSGATGISPLNLMGSPQSPEQIGSTINAIRNPMQTAGNIGSALVRGAQAFQPGFQPTEAERPFAKAGEVVGTVGGIMGSGGLAGGLLSGGSRLAADMAIGGLGTAIPQLQETGKAKVLPSVSEELGAIGDFIGSPSFSNALKVLPDSVVFNAAIPGLTAAAPAIVESIRKATKEVSLKILPFLFKGAANMPRVASKFAIEDPAVLSKLHGTEQSVAKHVSNVIKNVQKTKEITGERIGSIVKKYTGLDSPIDEILDSEPSFVPVYGKKTGEILGPDIIKTKSIPGGLRDTPDIDANLGTKVIPGEKVSYPSRSFTTSEPGPNVKTSWTDVVGSRPEYAPSRSWENVKADWKAAKDGSLFKKKTLLGNPEIMSNKEKLAVLTKLKREANSYARYFKQVGTTEKGLSPIDTELSGAAKRIASEISNDAGTGLRDILPNGKKLMVADNGWSAIHEIYNTIQSDLSNVGKARDTILRMVKGDSSWLTSGVIGMKIRALRRVEQIAGKRFLDDAMKEISASLFKEAYGSGLSPHMAAIELASGLTVGVATGHPLAAIAVAPAVAAGSPRVLGFGIKAGRAIGRGAQRAAETISKVRPSSLGFGQIRK